MTYFLARLREPSTYAALAAICAMFGYQMDAGLVQSIASAGTAVAGLAAILLRERA